MGCIPHIGVGSEYPETNLGKFTAQDWVSTKGPALTSRESVGIKSAGRTYSAFKAQPMQMTLQPATPAKDGLLKLTESSERNGHPGSVVNV